MHSRSDPFASSNPTMRLPVVSRLVALAVICGRALAAQPSTPAAPDSVIDLAATPSLVGDGVISASWSEFGAAVLPGEQAMFFTVTNMPFTRMTIMYAERAGGRWATPRVAPFSGEWNDGDPAASPDGRRIFYISNRPLDGNVARKDFDIWFVERTDAGAWSAPRSVGESVNDDVNVAYPSVASDGTLFFQKGAEVWQARVRPDGQYAPAERVMLGDGQMRVAAPAITPDKSTLFVIGAGANPRDAGDLFVAFRNGDSWTPPKRLAAPINSAFGETAPTVSADGRTLYFSSERIARSTVTWPRPKRVTSLAEVEAELRAVTLNGLRNIFAVDLSRLASVRP